MRRKRIECKLPIEIYERLEKIKEMSGVALTNQIYNYILKGLINDGYIKISELREKKRDPIQELAYELAEAFYGRIVNAKLIKTWSGSNNDYDKVADVVNKRYLRIKEEYDTLEFFRKIRKALETDYDLHKTHFIIK